MDAFVKQIPVSETIFGNIKKPPDIICVLVFLDCVYIQLIVQMSERVFFMILKRIMNPHSQVILLFLCFVSPELNE